MKKILLLIIMLFILTGCENQEELTSTYESKVKIEEKLTKDKRLVLFINNENEDNIDAVYEVKFLDEKNNILNIETEKIISLEKEAVIKIHKTPNNYQKYEINKKYYKSKYQNSGTKEIDIEIRKNEFYLDTYITNKGPKLLENVTISAVYYNGNEMIDVQTVTAHDMYTSSPLKVLISLPYDSNYKQMSYTEYKTYIFSAYSSKNN